MPTKKRTAKKAVQKKASKKTPRAAKSTTSRVKRGPWSVPRAQWPDERSAVEYIERTYGIKAGTVTANDVSWIVSEE